MSEQMHPMSFGQLMTWVLKEKQSLGTVFGVHKGLKVNPEKRLSLFGGSLETPYGPAAGPNTQMAQNIIAAYYAGARFFELKTVQIMDGAELAACVNKPCILAEDEGYNCEWSTELTVQEAYEEYVKAWMALSVLSIEWGLGRQDGFIFNMSVGYDLKGIQSPKINDFIDHMMHAENTVIYDQCRQWLLQNRDMFTRVTAMDLKAISPDICKSITVSTLHGCPPSEIEAIASYLIQEKHLHTYVKCNPTLLGYDFARERMDALGYDYVAFGDFHFKDDLQYEDAVPMIKRLMDLSKENYVAFGVKLTNTFPVDVTRSELPSEEMYMSGRALYPLSIALAAKLAETFEGKLPISYSGGADADNIAALFDAGIWPITVATTILKPGGYNRLVQLGEILVKCEYRTFEAVDVKRTAQLAETAARDAKYRKPMKLSPSRKNKQSVPLFDCFMAPCSEGCPIHQDIPAYVQLVGEGRFIEALGVIMNKNPLPWITGTICPHTCMQQCTRQFYDTSVGIRASKLQAAEGGYDAYLKTIVPAVKNGKRVAVVGGGPAGMAAAWFLARGGAAVTLYEKTGQLGGIVRHVIPSFRIEEAAIDRDAAFLHTAGVRVCLHTEIQSVMALREDGFEAIVLAIGAGKEGLLSIRGEQPLHALSVLRSIKEAPEQVTISGKVIVIGGGNSAMDTARAVKRLPAVESVSLVYRRDCHNMPADEEELQLAIDDGVMIRELLAPIAFEGGVLVCEQMQLGTIDASGRRSPEPTGKMVEVAADHVIAAVGERIDTDYYSRNGIEVDAKGYAQTDGETLESKTKGVYIIGDGLGGPATVVLGIRDAGKAAKAILSNSDQPAAVYKTGLSDVTASMLSVEQIVMRKGEIKHPKDVNDESERCLVCSMVCENCVDVCPNRANIAICVPGNGKIQILHLDRLCNECGNCRSFCPYSSAPYKDKLTLFDTVEAFEESTNPGFVCIDRKQKQYQIRIGVKVISVYLDVDTDPAIGDVDPATFKAIREMIVIISTQYDYLLV